MMQLKQLNKSYKIGINEYFIIIIYFIFFLLFKIVFLFDQFFNLFNIKVIQLFHTLNYYKLYILINF